MALREPPTEGSDERMTSDRDALLAAVEESPLDQGRWAALSDCCLEGGTDVADVTSHTFRVLRSGWDDRTKLAHVRLHLDTVRLALGLDIVAPAVGVWAIRIVDVPAELPVTSDTINEGIVTEILQEIARLRDDKRYGPYKVEYPPQLHWHMDEGYSSYNRSLTLRQRILEIPGVTAVGRQDPKATAAPRWTTGG